MLVLALDSSQKNISACLADIEKNQTIFCFNQLDKSQNLIEFIQEAFIQANLKPQKIEALAISCGPGSFTGIRATVTIAKALAHQLNLKINIVDNFKLARFLIKDDEKKIALQAGKNDFFISPDKNPENNYYSLELDGACLVNLSNINISKLIIDHLAIAPKNWIDADKLEPYYLREPSINKSCQTK